MLPDPLLKMLVDIVHGLEFFPLDLMLARTIPTPKKEKLSAENSRPITVLSTIYRLWGKVCGKRCLRHCHPLLRDSCQKGVHMMRATACKPS